MDNNRNCNAILIIYNNEPTCFPSLGCASCKDKYSHGQVQETDAKFQKNLFIAGNRER